MINSRKIIVLIVFILISASAQDIYTESNVSSGNTFRRYYLGVNLMSPWACIPYKHPLPVLILPVLANYEYGLTLKGGIMLNVSHGLESRVSLGLDKAYLIWQLHAGWKYYFKKRRNHRAHIGFTWRFADFFTRLSPLHNFQFIWSFHNGWARDFNERLFLDIAIHYWLAVMSWNNNPFGRTYFQLQASPAPHLFFFIPMLEFSLCLRF